MKTISPLNRAASKKQIPISKMMTLTAGLLLLTGPSIWAQDHNPEREQTIAKVAACNNAPEVLNITPPFAPWPSNGSALSGSAGKPVPPTRNKSTRPH